MFGRYRPGGGQMPNSDRSAQSINFGLFLRKAGGISNLMRTLQNLDLSTTARNFLGPFSESARNFRLIRIGGVFEHVNNVFFDEQIRSVYTFLRILEYRVCHSCHTHTHRG